MVVFFFYLDKMVSTFVYYHSGIALFAIGEEIKSSQKFKSTIDILNIWSNHSVTSALSMAGLIVTYIIVLLQAK